MEAGGAFGDIAFTVRADGGGDTRSGGAVDAFIAAGFGRIEDALIVVDMVFVLAFFGNTFAGNARAAYPRADERFAVAVVFAAILGSVSFAGAFKDVEAIVALGGDAFLIAASHFGAVIDIFRGADMAARAAVVVVGVPVDALTVAEAEGFVA